jgi:hypothetical protein
MGPFYLSLIPKILWVRVGPTGPFYLFLIPKMIGAFMFLVPLDPRTPLALLGVFNTSLACNPLSLLHPTWL